MSYTKQTWNIGDIITAQKLNHIEDGISVMCDLILKTEGESANLIGISYDEIESKIQSGQLITCYVVNKYIDATAGSLDYGAYYTPKFSYYSDEVNTYFRIDNLNNMAFTFNKAGVGAVWNGSVKASDFTWSYDSNTKEYSLTFST